MYERGVADDIRQVRREARQPKLFDRLLRVLDEQRGHTLAMDVEDAKIALSDAPTLRLRARLDRAGPERSRSAAPIWCGTPRSWPTASARGSGSASTQARSRRRRHRCGVPDRRLGAARACAARDHRLRARCARDRRRHLRRRRQGPDDRGRAALWRSRGGVRAGRFAAALRKLWMAPCSNGASIEVRTLLLSQRHRHAVEIEVHHQAGLVAGQAPSPRRAGW